MPCVFAHGPDHPLLLRCWCKGRRGLRAYKGENLRSSQSRRQRGMGQTEGKRMSDNPNAFPVYAGNEDFTDGMKLRDYFAASIIQGMESNERWNDFDSDEIAEFAYTKADAMLKARESNT